jgi:hypothetical protein
MLSTRKPPAQTQPITPQTQGSARMGRARPALNHADGLASRESGAGDVAWLVRPPTSSRLDIYWDVL